jgi:hypothetical protein
MSCEHCPAEGGGCAVCRTPLEKLREGHRKLIERLNDNANRRLLALRAIRDGNDGLALRLLNEQK